MTTVDIIKMFCDSDTTIKKIIDNRKLEYSSNYEEDLELLEKLKNKGLCTYTIFLNFLTKDNLASLIIRNYIFQYFKVPIFCNNVILENTTNDSIEAAKFHVQKIPFQLIAAESTIQFSEFMIEKNLYNDSLKFDKLIGFYINCKVKTDKTIFANIEKYATLFLVENDEIVILEKNDILKKWPYQRIDPGSKDKIFRGIYITGRPENITERLLNSLKDNLNLIESVEELKEAFDNNNILIKNQDRETSLQLLSPFVFEENDVEFVLNRLTIDYYFGIDKEKQRNFISDIVERSIDLIKIHSTKVVDDFNSDSENVIRYHEITKENNSLIKFISDCNNLEFGTDVLFIPKNTILSTEMCFKKLDDFNKQFKSILYNFFEKI